MEVEEKSFSLPQNRIGLKGGGEDGAYLGDEYEDSPSTLQEASRLRQVYRKLDLRIIPAFWVLYFLCSAVRANVG
jgi:hypothetical protein